MLYIPVLIDKKDTFFTKLYMSSYVIFKIHSTLCFWVQFTLEDAGWRIKINLRCMYPALFVWLDVGDIPGVFNSNGFLMVSEEYTVYFFKWEQFITVQDFSAKLHITSLRDIYWKWLYAQVFCVKKHVFYSYVCFLY